MDARSLPTVHVRARVGLCLTALILTGCATASTADPTPTTSTATGSATATTGTTAITASAGEPWILHGWGKPCAPAGDGSGLCLVHEDGTDAQTILTELGRVVDADWSHDGKSIVFVRDDSPGQLWIANTDGSDIHSVIGDPKRCATEARVGAWSPDDKHIAFMCLNGAQTEIAVADIATGDVSSVYLAADKEESWSPRWSPDGTRLVFERNPNDGNDIIGGSIVVIPVTGGTPTVIVPPSMFAGSPDWSSKGDLIVFDTYGIEAFLSGGPGATDLYTVHPDGTGLARLTHNTTGGDRDSQPTFTPDGTRIIFTHSVGYTRGGRGMRHTAFSGIDGTGMVVLDTDYASHPRLQPVS